MGNAFCVPANEVNATAPFQSNKYISPYQGFGGPITDRFAGAKIPNLAAEGPAAEEPVTTIPQLFEKAFLTKPDRIIMRTERPCPPLVNGKAGPILPLDQWKTWTVSEYLAEVKMAARAFLALGLGAKESVSIYGFNSPEWVMADMAAIFAGGIGAGIYPTDTPKQVVYKARHSGAAIACVETLAKAMPFLENSKDLPRLKAVVIWDEAITTPEAIAELKKAGGKMPIYHWSELSALAEKVSMAELDKKVAAIKPNECCTYIYTSGTTGAPKAVMITHDNIVFETRAALACMDMIGNEECEERVISYLPLSHVAGLMVDIVVPLVITAEKKGWMCSFFARHYDLKVSSIVERFSVVKPTFFIGVPRVWEKIAAKMIAAKQRAVDAGELSAVAQSVSEWGKNMGVQYGEAIQMGGNGRKPMMYQTLAEGLVQKKVKEILGLNECKFAFTGAAPISVETLRYFASVGIHINEVYGMSECTGACTWSTDKAHIWGSVGWAIPGVEVKVFKVEGGGNVECPNTKNLFACTEEEQGEICYRGRNIMMGYLANPDLGAEHVAEIEKKSADAIDKEGWLHSGDKGCRDERGMFRVTGRYKELLIGAGGENIAPVPIEDSIRSLCTNIVSNVMVVGDKMPFNCALITLKAQGATGELPGGNDLDVESLAFATNIGSDIKTVSEACAPDSPFIKALKEAIEATNKDEMACPMNAAKVQTFTILPRDFSVATDELTPTFKLKRGTVHEKYESVIADMYNNKDTYFQCPSMD